MDRPTDAVLFEPIDIDELLIMNAIVDEFRDPARLVTGSPVEAPLAVGRT